MSSGYPNASSRPRLISSAAAGLETIERDGKQQDQTHHQPLPENPNRIDDHGVLDQRDEKHAENAAEDRAFTAFQARASEHGGGDDLELDADTGVDHRAVEARGAQHTGNASQRSHD